MKAIYILGVGHSGPTLINLILDTSQNRFSLSELKFLKQLLKKAIKNIPSVSKNFKFLCDCGKKLKNCSFWSEIISNIGSSKLLSRSTKLSIKLKHFLYFLFNKRIEKSEEEKLYENILKQAKIW